MLKEGGGILQRLLWSINVHVEMLFMGMHPCCVNRMWCRQITTYQQKQTEEATDGFGGGASTYNPFQYLMVFGRKQKQQVHNYLSN